MLEKSRNTEHVHQNRDGNIRQIQFTREPQNVHFHLKSACIRVRYPQFNSNALVISQDFARHFQSEHIERLANEFGLGVNRQYMKREDAIFKSKGNYRFSM